MKNSTKAALLKLVAVGVDVSVPLVATLTQFPLWIQKSAEATMSGLCLMFIGLSIIPFFKAIKDYFKSPSSWVVFGVLFTVLLVLRSIIDQMLIVAFAGLVSNLIVAGLYAIGKRYDNKEDKKKQEKVDNGY